VIGIGRTFFVPSCLLSPKGSNLVLQDHACGRGGNFRETRKAGGLLGYGIKNLLENWYVFIIKLDTHIAALKI